MKTDYKIVKRYISDVPLKSKDKTRHIVEGKEVIKIYSLDIIQFHEDEGFYLIYKDNNQEITDTYHEDMLSAIEQAEWEFDLEKNKWRDFIQE